MASTDEVAEELSLPECLIRRAKLFGQRPALIDEGGSRCYTYEQVIELVTNCSIGLAELGLRRGDRVCFLLANCIDYPIAVLAVIRLGAVCVPANTMTTKYELRGLVADCEPKFFITVADRLGDIAFATSGVSGDIKVVTMTQKRGCTHFGSLLRPHKRGDLGPEVIKFDPKETVALICYSSGTTGKPKGCMQPHRNYIQNVLAFLSCYRSVLSDHDVTIASLPMFHSWGVLSHVVYGLYLGQTMIVVGKFDTLRYVRLIEKYKATVLFVVPPQLVRILRIADKDRLSRSLSSLRIVVSSAINLNDVTVREMLRVLPGLELSQSYGMTEIMLATLATPGSWKIGSCGKLVDKCLSKVIDKDTGRTLGPNENGEILIKSPSVLKGYWNNAEVTRSSFDKDGWFKTGDYGYFDDDGNLYIVDRIKDLLKYKGYSVAPYELESVLLMHPDVADAAVVGIPDDVDGDLPRALIVAKRSNASTDDIVAFVNERVSAYKRLRGGIEFVREIPRSFSGKILRRQLVGGKNIGNVNRSPPAAKL